MLDTFFFKKHLEEDEVLSKVVHLHWLMGVRNLAWPIVSLLIAWGFYALAPFRIILLLSALWNVYALVWLMRNFLDYYLDVWLITDQGIVDLNWQGWFHRQSTRVLYSDLQGVSYEIQGITSTLLRYGKLSMEKISTGTTISLTHVSHPRKIETLILKNMENYLHKKNLKNAKHVQELLAEVVAEKYQQKVVPHAASEQVPEKSAKPRRPMVSRKV